MSGATVTVRLIRSFEYRTVRLLVLHNINLDTETPKDLLKRVEEVIDRDANYKIFRNFPLGLILGAPYSLVLTLLFLDTLKIYVQPQASKSNHLVINFDEDSHLYFTGRTDSLAACGVRKCPKISPRVYSFNIAY